MHVNVAGFRGEGAVDGRVYLAMERVYGIDLRRLMADAGGLLPLARAVRIAYQAADGLAAVHERGFLHRDVKPENGGRAQGSPDLPVHLPRPPHRGARQIARLRR